MSPNIQISHELFPLVYKDVETGAFVAEILVPPITQSDAKQVQVLLDNNIVKAISDNEKRLLSKIGWLSGRDSILSINPSVAFVEQFLSSPDNVKSMIKDFEDRLTTLGIYEKGFADKFYKLLLNHQDSLRKELGTLFCYVALIFHWKSNFQNNTQSIDKWVQLFSEDIPRLQVFYLLGGFFAISGIHKNLCLKSNRKTIASFRQEFCSERKEEQNNLSRRLRNRSFDLLFFYQVPNLTSPLHKGYKSRILLVTKDKFLGELLCQLFCWAEVKEGSPWRLQFDEDKLLHENESSASLSKALMNGLSQGRPNSGEDTVRKRLNNLIGLTLHTVNNDMRAALKNSLKEFNIPYEE